MKIKLLVVGNTPKNYMAEGEAVFTTLIRKYIGFEKQEIPDLKNMQNLTKEQIKIEEGKLILQKLGATDFVVLLNEKGKEYRSLDFAQWLQNTFNQVPKHIVFIVWRSLWLF